jgi:predicted kinase
MKTLTLFILRGLPGSGKTTVAETLAEGKYPVCSADDYFMKSGEYKFNPALLGRAHEACKNKVLVAMYDKVERIFVANTNTTASEMKPYYDMAKEYGYRVVSLIVENRHDGINVHNVPDAALLKMKERFNIKL